MEAPSNVSIDLLTLVNACLGNANECSSNGEPLRALEFITKGLELNPPDDLLAMLYYKRAGIHEKLGSWMDVIQDTTTAIEKRPNFSGALFRRHEAHKKCGKLEQALEDLINICFVTAADPEIPEHIDTVLTILGKEEADKLMLSIHLQPKLPSKQTVKCLLEDFCDDPVTNWWNGVVVTGDGSGDSKLKGFPAAVALLHAHDYSKIIDLCNEELNNSESYFKDEASLLRGTFKYLWNYYHDEYLQDFNQVIESTTANKILKTSAWIKKGIAYSHRLKLTENSQMCFDRAQELTPENPDVYFQRCSAILESGNDDSSLSEASRYAKRALELNPNFSKAATMQGFLKFSAALLTNGPLEIMQAVMGLYALMDQFPTSAYLQNACGHVFKQLREPYSAYASFNRACELEPDSSTYKTQAIMSLHEITEDNEAALRSLESLVEVDDQSPNAYEHIGSIKHVTGDNEGASAAVEKGLQVCWLYQDYASLCALKKVIEVQYRVSAKVRQSSMEMDISNLLLGL